MFNLHGDPRMFLDSEDESLREGTCTSDPPDSSDCLSERSRPSSLWLASNLAFMFIMSESDENLNWSPRAEKYISVGWPKIALGFTK